MKILNSFIIKISFATQTGEKNSPSREHWLMAFSIEESPEGDGNPIMSFSCSL